MSTTTENSPTYIEKAKFINQEEQVDTGLWPNDPTRYSHTKQWSTRIKDLEGIITQSDIESTIECGELYSSISNSVTFVKELDGVALYVIVSGELMKFEGSYPTNPSEFDYLFKAVTLWAYVYDEHIAEKSSRWSSQDIDEINKFCRDQSGQSEISKHKLKR